MQQYHAKTESHWNWIEHRQRVNLRSRQFAARVADLVNAEVNAEMLREETAGRLAEYHLSDDEIDRLFVELVVKRKKQLGGR